jgi:hypothetical protein
LIAGARRVIASRDGLNRINVFPVADGDTGNNLASTLGSVLNGALSRRSRHAGELPSRVATTPSTARGNSGAILAQFLHGVAEHVRLLPSLDARSLAAAVRHGAASARLALAKPVEGTIVSVITAFAEELERRPLASDRRPLRRAGRGRTPARSTARTHRHRPVIRGGNRCRNRRSCGAWGFDRGSAARAAAMKRLPSRA